MKKILLVICATVILATNAMAEIKPFLGLGLNMFTISSSDITARDKTTGATASSSKEPSDSGIAAGINGGAILNDNSKITFSYFSGKEDESKIFTTSVMAISYDYSFNNFGIRNGFFLGAGISSVKTQIEDNQIITSSSESTAGLLARVGYEYKINKNLLFDVTYNIHLAEQDLKYDYKAFSNIEGSTSTSVSNLNISINYLF